MRWSFLLAASFGCVSTPPIVVVDRATVLEEQAAGSFDQLELKLARAGIAPRPVPLTPAQLEALGMKPLPLIDRTDLTDADRLDDLLVQHCVGEGRDGLLVDTRAACRGSVDEEQSAKLVERANRARQQLWNWMQTQRPNVPLETLRASWRRTHALGVVCGGWVQRDDGTWEAKQC